MVTKSKKKSKPVFTAELYEIEWYPHSKSCVQNGKSKQKLDSMPPLMVRKAEWRS